MAQGLLVGKRFLIAGIASKLSIAFGIAQALHLVKVLNLLLLTQMKN